MRALKIALLAAALMPAAAYAQPIQGLYVSGGGGLAWLENQRLLSTTQGGTTTVYRPAPANNFRAGFNGFASLGWALAKLLGNTPQCQTLTSSSSSLCRLFQSARPAGKTRLVRLGKSAA